MCVCVCSGVISGNTVRCPWHGACFNIHTGDLEEYPGMDCLPCHKVQTTPTDIYSHFNVILKCVFFSFEGQNSKQQSLRVCKQKSKYTVNFSFMVLPISSLSLLRLKLDKLYISIPTQLCYLGCHKYIYYIFT